jgi:hypothetical protein
MDAQVQDVHEPIRTTRKSLQTLTVDRADNKEQEQSEVQYGAGVEICFDFPGRESGSGGVLVVESRHKAWLWMHMTSPMVQCESETTSEDDQLMRPASQHHRPP